MKLALQNVLWMFVLVAYIYLCVGSAEQQNFMLGVFLNEENSQAEVPLNHTVRTINMFDSRVNYQIVRKIISKNDSFAASKALCEMTAEGVSAIFGPPSVKTSATLQSICSHLEVPYILTSWRPSSTEYLQTVINFFPDAELLAKGLARIVKGLGWKTFVLLYETEDRLVQLQEILKLEEYQKDDKRNNIVLMKLGSGPDYRLMLKKIVQDNALRNIVLDCETENIINILEQARELGLFKRTVTVDIHIFLTSLDAHTLDYSPLENTANITTIRLFDPKNEDFIMAVKNWTHFYPLFSKGNDVNLNPNMIKTETALMYDAISYFTESVSKLSLTSDITSEKVFCNDTNNGGFTKGLMISNFIQKIETMNPITHPLTFKDEIEEDRSRNGFELQLIELQERNIIATWNSNETESLTLLRNESEHEQKVLDNLRSGVVRVVARIEPPYLEKKVDPENKLEGNERYYGYSMDLIDAISKILNFSYEFHVVNDATNDDLINDLVEKRAHLAICDLTITHQRREKVDFSNPFMNLGVAILYVKNPKKPLEMFAFLKPFSYSVWIYTGTLYLILSIVLYFISRMAPDDWENPHPCDENPEELENIWDIKNCLWLTLGSIMTQGCDILPKGKSSRMATSMWWFFSLIMTSSYTANLAAFLTMDKMDTPIKSAEDLAKQSKIKYGAVNNGSTQGFFRDSNYSVYERMWINMKSSKPSVWEKDNAGGVQRVLNSKGTYAFLMESTQIEYVVQTECKLKKVGTNLDNKGYGIGMPLNSGYRSMINKAVLNLSEDGVLTKLKKRWWVDMRGKHCTDNKEVESGDELSMAHLGGAFVVLGVGIAIAFILAIAEFLWNVHTVAVEEHISYLEALKVEVSFAINIWVTKKRTKPVISESSSSSSSSNTRSDRKSMARSILHGAGSFLKINKIGSTLSINRE